MGVCWRAHWWCVTGTRRVSGGRSVTLSDSKCRKNLPVSNRCSIKEGLETSIGLAWVIKDSWCARGAPPSYPLQWGGPAPLGFMGKTVPDCGCSRTRSSWDPFVFCCCLLSLVLGTSSSKSCHF